MLLPQPLSCAAPGGTLQHLLQLLLTQGCTCPARLGQGPAYSLLHCCCLSLCHETNLAALYNASDIDALSLQHCQTCSSIVSQACVTPCLSALCNVCGCRRALVTIPLCRAGLPRVHKCSRQREGATMLLLTLAQTSAPEVWEALIRPNPRCVRTLTSSGFWQPRWLHNVCVNKQATGLY